MLQKQQAKRWGKSIFMSLSFHLNSPLLLLQSMRRCDKLKYCPASDLMRISVLPCAWGKPGKLAAALLKGGNGCQGIWKGYSAVACKLLWDHPAEQLCENSGFAVSQCRHILGFLLLWWWQWWLLISVSFLSGVCLGGSFFHLFAKPPPASILNHLGLRSVSFCIRNKCPSINRVLFFGKNNSEFRSCLHLFRIANRISTVLQRLICFVLFVLFLFHNCSDWKTARSVPLHPAHLDGDRGEQLLTYLC